MHDFRDMVNHLLGYGLYHRSESAVDLRKGNNRWFKEHYSNRYASHYLQSACGYAIGILRSWREVGESRMPHLYRPLVRFDQMLFVVKELTPFSLRLQITIAPWQFEIIEVRVNHKKWNEYSKFKLGEITLHPDCIDLPFQCDERKTKSADLAGIDLNFNRAVIAKSDGTIHEVRLDEITDIQARMRRKRDSIQKSIPDNLQKQRRVLAKYNRREHNRVKDPLIAKAKEIVSIIGDAQPVLEDLSSTTKECMKDAKGKKFRVKLNSWAHGALQERIVQYSPHRSKMVYARGTSSYCAFCGAEVTHPRWVHSYCDNHGLLDRDKNASVNILVRGQTDLRRPPFAPSVIASLLEQSVPDHHSNVTVGLENRTEAMTGDASNVMLELDKVPT